MNWLKPILFIVCVFCGSCSFPNQTFLPWENELSMEQNVAKNAIALASDEEFFFLDNIIRGRSVILLGEEGHSDYMTSIIRLKMIKYLQDKGFNSIAFEGHSFLRSYISSNPKYKELTEKWKTSPFLSSTEVLIHNTQIYQSFLEEIRKQNIRIWGIDCYSDYYDIRAVKTILSDYSDQETLSIDWDRLNNLYIRKFVPYWGIPDVQGKLSVTEQYELMRIIDTISNHTQYLMFSKGAALELKVIMQWIRNLNTLFSHIETLDTIENIIGKEAQRALDIRNRDSQMAENIDWIIKNFPEEKLIVWIANFHGAKDISQTQYPTDSLLYFNLQSTGEFLYATQGEKMYSLAFTSYRNEQDRGKLEEEISNATEKSPYAFIDFEPLRFADGYRDQAFESSVIRKKQGKWLYIFDGLYYIRDQKNE